MKIKRKKIFTNLEHEKCEECEQFKLHDYSKDSIQEVCDTYIIWKIHETKYMDVRNL